MPTKGIWYQMGEGHSWRSDLVDNFIALLRIRSFREWDGYSVARDGRLYDLISRGLRSHVIPIIGTHIDIHGVGLLSRSVCTVSHMAQYSIDKGS